LGGTYARTDNLAVPGMGAYTRTDYLGIPGIGTYARTGYLGIYNWVRTPAQIT